MRGLFFGGGMAKRNDPIRLVPSNPHPRFAEQLDTGDAGQDGYSVLSRGSPGSGYLPPVAGQAGPTFRGPNQSWEE